MKKFVILLILAMVLTLVGCGGEAAPSETAAPAAEPVALNIQEIYDLLTAVENMPEMIPLEPDMQLNFCGINPDDCLQSAVAICADGLRTDEIWLIEAKDAEALERIQAAAETRLTAKDEESATYSPEQNAIVKKAERITTGNYFVLLVSPDVETLAGLFRTAAGI